MNRGLDSIAHLLILPMLCGLTSRDAWRLGKRDSSQNWNSQVPDPLAVALSSSLSLGISKRWTLTSSIPKWEIKSLSLGRV